MAGGAPAAGGAAVGLGRSDRVVAALVAVALLGEAAAVAFFVLRSAQRLASGIPQIVRIFYVGPGLRLHPHLDLGRAVVFAVAAVGAMAVLVVAAGAAPWGRRARLLGRSRLARTCAGAAIVGNAVGCAVALAVVGLAGGDPFLRRDAAGLAAAFGLTATLGILLVRRVPAPRRMLPWAAVTALGLCGALVGTQRLDIGAYERMLPPPALRWAGDVVPVNLGFTTLTISQQPASDTVLFVSCGSPQVCVLFGDGLQHQLDAGTGEVTVTTDGGRTWRSWFLPPPLDGYEPWEFAPSCQDAVCAGLTRMPAGAAGSGVYRLEVLPTGGVTESIVSSTHLPWSLGSCPAPGWCAGLESGSATQAPGLVTTDDWWASHDGHPFPAWLVPTGDGLEGGVTCATAGDCVVIGVLVPLPRSTETQPAPSRVGSSVVAATPDAGGTWSVATLPPGVTFRGALQCPGPTTCFMVGSVGTHAALLRSGDGGRTWEEVPNALPAPSAWLVCGDATHCLSLGASVLDGAVPVAYHTSDGGRQWQVDPLPSPRRHSSLSVGAAACSGPRFCVLTGMRRSETSVEPVVLTTHDGGTSWREQPMPVPRPVRS